MQQPNPYQAQAYEYQRQAAAGRSYTTPAIITLVLYFVFWFPGLIANLIYLSAASTDKRVSGVEPQGRGCLLALAIVFVILPIASFVLMFGFSFIRALLGG